MEATDQQLRDLFVTVDNDGDGFITRQELQTAFKLLGQDITPQKLQSLLRSIGQGDLRQLDVADFLRTIARISIDRGLNTPRVELGGESPLHVRLAEFRRRRLLSSLFTEGPTAMLKHPLLEAAVVAAAEKASREGESGEGETAHLPLYAQLAASRDLRNNPRRPPTVAGSPGRAAEPRTPNQAAEGADEGAPTEDGEETDENVNEKDANAAVAQDARAASKQPRSPGPASRRRKNVRSRVRDLGLPLLDIVSDPKWEQVRLAVHQTNKEVVEYDEESAEHLLEGYAVGRDGPLSAPRPDSQNTTLSDQPSDRHLSSPHHAIRLRTLTPSITSSGRPGSRGSQRPASVRASSAMGRALPERPWTPQEGTGGRARSSTPGGLRSGVRFGFVEDPPRGGGSPGGGGWRGSGRFGLSRVSLEDRSVAHGVHRARQAVVNRVDDAAVRGAYSGAINEAQNTRLHAVAMVNSY